MRELWPTPDDEVDIDARLAGDHRPKPAGRPWVCMVMIETIDGAIAIDGASAQLGGPSDQAHFVAARRMTDGIVVGATTAAVEDYRPADTPIAVITGSLSPDPAARLFRDPERAPILFTTSQAASTRGSDFAGVAEVVSLGESIDPMDVLANLDSRGMQVVMLEGGPTLNGQFLAADLVDELLLTISPRLTGGGPGLVSNTLLGSEHVFRVDRVLLADDMLFIRYLRRRP